MIELPLSSTVDNSLYNPCGFVDMTAINGDGFQQYNSRYPIDYFFTPGAKLVPAAANDAVGLELEDEGSMKQTQVCYASPYRSPSPWDLASSSSGIYVSWFKNSSSPLTMDLEDGARQELEDDGAIFSVNADLADTDSNHEGFQFQHHSPRIVPQEILPQLRVGPEESPITLISSHKPSPRPKISSRTANVPSIWVPSRSVSPACSDAMDYKDDENASCAPSHKHPVPCSILRLQSQSPIPSSSWLMDGDCRRLTRSRIRNLSEIKLPLDEDDEPLSPISPILRPTKSQKRCATADDDEYTPSDDDVPPKPRKARKFTVSSKPGGSKEPFITPFAGGTGDEEHELMSSDDEFPVLPCKKTGKTPGSKQTRVSCPLCSRSFTRGADLERHNKSSCPNRKDAVKAICSICDKSLVRPDALKRHMRSHRRGTIGARGEKKDRKGQL